MAAQTTLLIHHPIPLRSARPIPLSTPILPRPLSFNSLRKPSKPMATSSSLSPNLLKISAIKSTTSDHHVLSGSTRTLTTLFAVSLTASTLITGGIFNLAVQLKEPLISAAGPAFFAAVREFPTRSLNTPLTVVAAGMAKWLDIYSGVLMVRVLLSWFPNIPWDRQPLCAIRDLCDPYLNLFRNIIPPIFNALDVSPLLAFAVLGTLASILQSTRSS